MSKGTFLVKKNFLESSVFLQTLQNFQRTFTVLGRKVFGRDIKIESCSLRLIRSITKIKFLKVLFFSNSSELWTNIYRAWQKSFRQGYENWKLQSSSHKINQKNQTFESTLFFKFFRTLNEHLPCLAKNFWTGISKLKNVLYVFRVSFWRWK